MDHPGKEQLLHKVIAASAFAFSLCILPLTNHIIHTSQVEKAKEEGNVAGVTTEEVVLAGVPAPTYATAFECNQAKATELAGLETYAKGKKLALQTQYEAAVLPYREAVKLQTEQLEIDALNQLIDQEYQPYLKKLVSVESAVASQKEEIDSRVCPEE